MLRCGTGGWYLGIGLRISRDHAIVCRHSGRSRCRTVTSRPTASQTICVERSGHSRGTHRASDPVCLESLGMAAKLSDRGLGKGGLEDLPASLDLQTRAFVQAQAALAAGLRCLTRRVGLSLGDQACLALTISEGLPAVTTDRSWSRLAPAIAAEVSWPDDSDPDAAGPLDSRQMAGGLVERGGSASRRWAGSPPRKPAIRPRERRDESRSPAEVCGTGPRGRGPRTGS